MMYVWYSSIAEMEYVFTPSSNSSSQGSALCKIRWKRFMVMILLRKLDLKMMRIGEFILPHVL